MVGERPRTKKERCILQRDLLSINQSPAWEGRKIFLRCAKIRRSEQQQQQRKQRKKEKARACPRLLRRTGEERRGESERNRKGLSLSPSRSSSSALAFCPSRPRRHTARATSACLFICSLVLSRSLARLPARSLLPPGALAASFVS